MAFSADQGDLVGSFGNKEQKSSPVHLKDMTFYERIVPSAK